MYQDYFGVKEIPFTISPNPRYLHLTNQHQETVAKCELTIYEKMGIAAIFGDIGAGKTSIVYKLHQDFLENDQINFARLLRPDFPSTYQFINEIRREFGFTKHRRSTTESVNEFKAYLYDQDEKGKINVLVIDEAQQLKPTMFEELRQLLNFESESNKFLQVLLFGQNELAPKIDRYPELKDRIMIFGALTSLTQKDVHKLIRHRWIVAGGDIDQLPFEEGAVQEIFKYSKGFPRKIIKICHNALIKAFSADKKTVDQSLIKTVAEELRLNEDKEPLVKSPGRKKKKKVKSNKQK